MRIKMPKRTTFSHRAFVCASFCLLLWVAAGCEKPSIPLPDHPGGQIFHGIKRADVRCAKCHGNRGEGASRAPALVQSGKTLPQAQFVTTVLEGQNQMPPYSSVLTEAEVISIMDWLSKIPPQ